MGSEDADNPTKTPKSSSAQEQNETPPKSSSAQEQPPPSSPATVFPDWASYQAYYNSVGTPPIPPPGFFHSSVASSPHAHPYMWGQHMMPPYGTPPPPYVTMYPHGLYAHPSMPPGSHPFGPYTILSPNGTTEVSTPAAGGDELEGKSGGGKSKLPLKRSKGSLGSLSMLTGKGSETGKTSGVSDNGGGFSQSGGSGGEGSSEGSDANSQNGSQQSEKGCADAEAQNGGTVSSVLSGANQVLINQSMVIPMPSTSVPGPTTNLNIGMDYWGGSAPPQVATSRAKLPTVQPPGTIVPSSGVPSELWIQDERELKRQRRKQSNRESARRSRLRKQAEYDELAQRVETLKEENTSLREELERIREDCEKLASENASLTDKLQKHQGQDSRVDRFHGQPESNPQVDANL